MSCRMRSVGHDIDGEKGYDFAFMQHIQVRSETQKRLQSFYLTFFDGCQLVVDLGCGNGDFLQVLGERGIKGVGVDRESLSCEAATDRGLEVVCSDVFTFLEELEQGRVDGIFCSHLVEHLPYRDVIRLLRLSHQALPQGGRIVLTTPNVRGLYSHLEGFYLHFDHVRFYHPQLLSFFLDQVGFVDITDGENPYTERPLLGEMRFADFLDPTSTGRRGVRGLFNASLSRMRGLALKLLGLERALRRADLLLERLDRPFECYVTARKG